MVIELAEGQEVSLATADGRSLTRVHVGIGWDKVGSAGFAGSGAADVDLDASALQFAGSQFFDIAFYNNLATRDGSLTHEGDNLTGSGHGDDERLTLDLPKVYRRVDTILFLVSSYQGHTLEFIRNAYCRVVDDHDVELIRFRLTSGVPHTGLVMAKLVRQPERGDAWSLETIGRGVAVTVPTQSIDQMSMFL